MVLPFILGRVAARFALKRAAVRVAPLLPKIGSFTRRAAKFLFTTKRGLATQVLGAAAITSPTIRRKITKTVKKDPTALLLLTPAAPIFFGRQVGRATEITREPKTSRREKLTKLAKVGGIVGLGAGALITAGVLTKKAIDKKAATKLALPPVGTPTALLAAPIAGAIPTQAVVSAKEEKPKMLPAPIKQVPMRITSSPKINIVIQNAFS